MVLLHALRCLQYRRAGIKARQVGLNEVSAALGAAARGPHAPTVSDSSGGGGGTGAVTDATVSSAFAAKYMGHCATTSVYCGLRMIDVYGHVNNAKYLEILEYGRWYQLSLLGLADVFKKRGLFFVVSELSIQYVREIKPFSNVQVTTQTIPSSDGPTPLTGSESATNPPNKRLISSQAIWNADGSKLHAASLVEAALLGPPSYAQYLTDKYPYRAGEFGTATSEGSARKLNRGPARSVMLDCHRVLADGVQMPIERVDEILYGARRDFLASMAKGAAAAGTAETSNSTAWLNAMSTANREWRASIRKMANPSTRQEQ